MTDFCPDCGDELDDFAPCACIFTPRRAAPARAVVSTTMREMNKRRLDARSPTELALATLAHHHKMALLSAADGLPIGRRNASTLAQRGMALPDVAPRPRGRVACTLSPLGIAVANLQKQRNACRKEKGRAPAAGE